MRERAHQLCLEFLKGAWEDITPEELVFKPITGGLTNILYYCGLPNSHKPRSKEPTEVLLRIYGLSQDDGVEAVLTDSVIFTILSERELGPKLYGTFPGGRLEEFIPSTTMKVTEMVEEQYVQKIATKMAIVHSLDIPMSKDPTFLKNTMEKWLKTYKDIISSGNIKCEDVDKFALEKVKSFNYEKEVNYVLDLITKRLSDVVFSHNDLQEGNILINQTNNNNNNNDNQITMIDFEYCSYNYRAYDLANHFCEYRYDYTVPDHPYFVRIKDQLPSKEQQLLFICSYIKSLKNSKSLNLNEEKLLKDIKVCALASSLFWSLWSFVQSQSSTIAFGYMQWANERIIDYNNDKEKLDS